VTKAKFSDEKRCNIHTFIEKPYFISGLYLFLTLSMIKKCKRS